MRKHRLLWIAVLAAVLLLSIPRPAYAYMDPGTTGSIFVILAPFIAIFLAFVGFLIRPFRRLFASIVARVRGGRRVESIANNEQPLSGEPTDDEKSRENTSEDLKS
jgi:hypothetical protein